MFYVFLIRFHIKLKNFPGNRTNNCIKFFFFKNVKNKNLYRCLKINKLILKNNNNFFSNLVITCWHYYCTKRILFTFSISSIFFFMYIENY